MKTEEIKSFLDELLKDVDQDDWSELIITIKKKGDGFLIAVGADFGPFITTPKILPK